MNGRPASATLLANALDRSRAEERRRALRALLARPLLPARHPAFPLVRRHAEALRQWLVAETGWSLQVEGDFARLHKRVACHDDGTRPAGADYPAADPPFSRRRYCLLCLALAVLEKGEAQTALGRLGEQVVTAAAEPALLAAGIRFALDNREERRDLVAVVRHLLALGVLIRVAGDEDAFIDAAGDALYDVNRRILSALPVTVKGSSMVNLVGDPGTTAGRIAALTETFVPDTVEGRNRALRRRLTGRLLDDPVVYWDELEETERAYLTSQRAAIAARIREATGLLAEVRAEGIALVDDAGELTDCRLPSEGTDGHLALLTVTWLAERAGVLAKGETVPVRDLEEAVKGWMVRYGRFWKKAAREPGAERELCRQALERLVALRLAEATGAGIRPLPAIGRYAMGETLLPIEETLDL
ncbi:TIGR02678 family protein [Trichloromonas sp.]|uniref:TIGR02678 family protein n=1 Tax=Trichloromonas sp. TaxID=3069249 RepID=UPI002A4D7330|nr:TIGR02678 family protein [Trichloromonas sp.]